MDTWDIIKSLLSWVIYPILCLFGYMYKKNVNDLEELKKEVSALKINQAVSISQIEDIRNDIKDLVQIVRDTSESLRKEIRSIKP